MATRGARTVFPSADLVVVRIVLAFLAAAFVRLLRLTWRLELAGPEPDYGSGPIIFCFWHGDQAGLLAHPRPRPVVVMSSLSADGELQSHILTRLGFIVTRGSSSHGGAAGLKTLIREIGNGADAAFAVDGPRGPFHKVKPGAITAARETEAIIVPIVTHASRAWVFKKAWDKYSLPKLFARVKLVRGRGIRAQDINTGMLEETLEILR